MKLSARHQESLWQKWVLLVKRGVVFGIVFLVFAASATSTFAAVGLNRVIPFQGKVVNKTDGTNVADGTYSFTFKIYDAASSGNLLWQETQSTVSVTSGIFSVNLGSSTAFNGGGYNVDFKQNNLYLDITFNGETFGSRIQLAAVPQAINAEQLDGVVATQSASAFTLTGGTSTPRTLTIAGADITIGSTITPTSTGGLTVQSNGANALTLDTGGSAALNIGATANAITFGATNNPTYSFNGTGAVTFQGTSFTLGNGSTATLQTTGNAGLTLLSAGSGNITLGQNLGNGNVVVQPNAGGKAAFIINDQGLGDIFTASAAGSTKFVISNSGNVGIGITSPTALLDVVGTASVSSSLTFRSGAATIQTTSMSPLTIGSSTTGPIQLSPKGTTGLVVNSDGTVGIGQAGYAYALTVNGSIGILGASQIVFQSGGGTSNIGSDWGTYNTGDTTHPFQMRNSALIVGYTATGGYYSMGSGLFASNVGVGSTAFGNAMLGVNQTNFSGAGDIFTASAAGSTKFVINNSGQVGIGLNNPSKSLEVTTSTAGDGIQLDGSSKHFWLSTNLNAGTLNPLTGSGDEGIFYGGTAADTGTPGFDIAPWSNSISGIHMDTTGRVGIGTTPGDTLDVWNNANSAVYNEAARFVVTNNAGGTNYSRLLIGQNTTNAMFVEAADQNNFKGNLLFQPWGGGVIIGQTGSNGNAELVVNQSLIAGDIFAASTSGTTKFKIANDGGVTGTGWSVTSAGVLSVNSCSGCSATATTLQVAYNNGNTINLSNNNLVLGNSYTGVGNVLINPGAGGQAALIVNKANATGDIFTASASGTTKFVIDNSGSVYIGTTTNPNSNILVASASATGNGLMSVANAANGANSGGGLLAITPNMPTAADQRLGLLAFGAPTSPGSTINFGPAIAALSSQSWSSSVGGGYLAFYTQPNGTSGSQRSERMRIDQAGNVGIGTTSPSNLLTVSNNSTNGIGGIFLSGNSANYTGIQIGRTASDGTLGIAAAGGQFSTDAVAGDVIFRNDNFANNLLLQTGAGASVVAVGANGVGIENTAFGNGALVVNQANRSGVGDIFSASSSGSTKFVINNAGSVGIGTNNPGAAVTLYKTGVGNSRIRVDSDSNYAGFEGFTNGTREFLIQAESTGNAYLDTAANLIIRPGYLGSSGSVSIGTTNPLSQTGLHVSKNGLGNAIGVFDQLGGGDIFTASASGSTKFVISNAGNVGIGTTSPGMNLDIQSAFSNNSIGFRMQDTGSTNQLFLVSKLGTGGYNSLSQASDLGIFTGTTTGLVIAPWNNTNMGVRFNFLSGAVGIGNSAANANAALIVNQNNYSGLGDIFAASASGSPKFVINNSGNVGIGTNNPNAPLQIASNNNNLYLGDTTNAASYVNFNGRAFVGYDSSYALLQSGAGHSLKLMVNNSTFGSGITGLYVSSPVGNVGVGTTTNLGNAQFVVNQTNGSGLGDIFTASTSGSTKFVINNSGYVGIGVTNPGDPLDVLSSTTSNVAIFETSGARGVNLQLDNQAGGQQSKITFQSGFADRFQFGLQGDNSFFMYSNGFNKDFIDLDTIGNLLLQKTGGSVVIGTTANIGNAELVVNQPNTAGDIFTASTSGGTKFVINNSGNVGIGTITPDETLQVNGLAHIGTNQGSMTSPTTSNTNLVLYNFGSTNWSGIGADGGGAMYFTTGTSAVSSRMVIDPSGNVGIGTTGPSATLHLVGTAILDSSGGAGQYITIRSSSGVTGQGGLRFDQNSTHYFSMYTKGTGTTPNYLEWTNDGTNVMRLDNTGAVVLKSTLTQSSTPDISEGITASDSTINAGDIVSADPTQQEHIIKSGKEYDTTSLGVISTKPGIYMNAGVSSDLDTTNPNYRPIVLAGRVPTKVWSKSGSIQIGDPITSSTLSGFGTKATQAGVIVARAVENFTPSDASCPAVASANDIQWPSDDGTNAAKPCYKLPDGTYVGKIMAYIKTVWNDPQVYLTDTGSFVIHPNTTPDATYTPAPSYTVTDLVGKAISRVGVFSDATVGNFKAGGITASTISGSTPLVINGDTNLNLLLQGLSAGQNASADAILALLTSSPVASDTALSQVVTDRVVAGLDIISPKVTTNEISAQKLNFTSTDGLTDLLTQISTSSAIVVAPRLEVAGLATVSADLRVKGNGLVEGIFSVIDTLKANNFIVTGISDFFDNVIFHKNVAVQGTVTFNKDTAGNAVVQTNTTQVDVTFGKAYDTKPIVTASFAIDQQASASGSVMSQNALQTTILNGGYTYVVTNVSTKGFTILLNKPATVDIPFSWHALSIDNPTTVESGGGLQLSPSPVGSPSAN